MNYPKPIMRKTELEKMGFPKEFLLTAARSRSQTFAWKMNPAKRNSPLMFDTEGLEKYRLSLTKAI